MNNASIGSYQIVDEQHGFMLLRTQDNRGTVIRIDRTKFQVYDAMPGDAPKEGGAWCSSLSEKGIKYVSSLYSWTYARRIFRASVQSAQSWAQYLDDAWEADPMQ